MVFGRITLGVITVLFALGLSLPVGAFGDVVVPSDRVSGGLNVRAAPNITSQILAVLKPGDQVEYVGSVPGWHEVVLGDGRHGFVSKSWTRIVSAGTAGSFTIDVVDVGTGLAIVAKGDTFVLVYDGGSNDDLARGDANRFLSFIRSQRPELTTIDHLILSHPHRDHVELLPDVITTYTVRKCLGLRRRQRYLWVSRIYPRYIGQAANGLPFCTV